MAEARCYYGGPFVYVEAMRHDGTNASGDAILAWSMGMAIHFATGDDRCEIRMDTWAGTMTAEPGDWVIRDPGGGFYPCKPDAFAATYDDVDG